MRRGRGRVTWMRRGRGVATAIALVASVSCGPAARNAAPVALEPDDAALVGQRHVKLATVDRIAGAQHLSRRDALDVALRDALLASLGEARIGPRDASGIRRAAAARAMVEDISRLARERGPITDAEVDSAIGSRWWELDRPRMLRTCHAVALTEKPGDDPAALAVARSILDRVKGVSDPEEFKRLARGVPAGTVKVRVEDLDPVAEDGRALDPEVPHPADSRGARYDADFVRAVFAIDGAVSSHGARTSPVVKTPFGYHVILLVKEIPELHVSREEARSKLAPDLLEHREKTQLDELRGALRRGTPVEIDRAALELMAKVEVAP